MAKKGKKGLTYNQVHKNKNTPAKVKYTGLKPYSESLKRKKIKEALKLLTERIRMVIERHQMFVEIANGSFERFVKTIKPLEFNKNDLLQGNWIDGSQQDPGDEHQEVKTLTGLSGENITVTTTNKPGNFTVSMLSDRDDLGKIDPAVWDELKKIHSTKIFIGYGLGEVCNRDECDGIISEYEGEGGCSCHINPPCSYCMESREYCPKCGWDGKEEQSEAERSYKSNHVKNEVSIPEFKLQEVLDDGKLYDVVRYFDSVYEATVSSGLNRPDAVKKQNQYNDAKPRHYVYYGIVDHKSQY